MVEGTKLVGCGARLFLKASFWGFGSAAKGRGDETPKHYPRIGERFNITETTAFCGWLCVCGCGTVVYCEGCGVRLGFKW